MTYAVAYVATLVVMLAIDAVWLSSMANVLYRPTLGDVMLASPRIAPAVAFYLIYPIGVLIFAVLPALRTGSVSTALMYGALFGFFAYVTYDLTNYATIRNWSLQLTIVDTVWGTALTGVAATAGYYAGKWMGGAPV